jgi:hypothetical protein
LSCIIFSFEKSWGQSSGIPEVTSAAAWTKYYCTKKQVTSIF